MTKRRWVPRGITLILVVASLLSILTLTTAAAPITDTKTIPVGQTSFSIDLRVNEPTPYAGIEFALTISDASALTFASFTSIPSGASASPFIEKGGLYYFGFFKIPGENVYPAGDSLAGTLNFTGYTGNQALTITVVEMNVTRLDASNQAITSKKESPSYVYSIQREGSLTNFYTVAFDAAGGTRIGGGALSQSVAEGGAAIAPIVERSGYTFTGWDKTFTNVTSGMTVTAQWTPRSSGTGSVSTSYTVTFDPSGGTHTGGGALVQTVNAGSAAVAPTVTREGYIFNGWDRTFTNVASNIIVTAQWIEGEEVPNPDDPLAKPHEHYFDDVTDTLYSWAEVAVCALAEADVIKGTANRTYAPAANIKRGDFILMLARAYELDEPFTENFSDVPKGSYYYAAIGSAKALGIARGYGIDEFRPEASISRQEMMAIIDRTMDTIGKSLPRGSETDLLSFSDQDLIADYAWENVAALVKSGIIVGSNNHVNPMGYTTRAEMAVALYRLMIATGDLTTV